ncbi:hypothetical protein BV25DRAFT_1825974 [Artomyces pyxidatus]|uniref:Uncharacterized protein n=1 Tax=Artomyces pyxidatus TaxID=48021 RepID=A0ACB8T0B5_9AGAM|nr:hypothetical protein BV25DRAFT_1825974 [Artomyces pyxidatus]
MQHSVATAKFSHLCSQSRAPRMRAHSKTCRSESRVRTIALPQSTCSRLGFIALTRSAAATLNQFKDTLQTPQRRYRFCSLGGAANVTAYQGANSSRFFVCASSCSVRAKSIQTPIIHSVTFPAPVYCYLIAATPNQPPTTTSILPHNVKRQFSLT